MVPTNKVKTGSMAANQACIEVDNLLLYVTWGLQFFPRLTASVKKFSMVENNALFISGLGFINRTKKYLWYGEKAKNSHKFKPSCPTKEFGLNPFLQA